jgi:L-lactate dehydrogenase complex protein LldG
MFSGETGFLGRIKHLLGGVSSSKDTEVMPTRKVVGFDENEVPRPTSFADIINEPISTSTPVGLRTVEPTAPSFTPPTETDLEIRFAENFNEQGGCFVYCETLADTIEVLQHLKQEHGWKHIFTWENEIKDIFCEHNFQRGAIGFTIANSDAAISLCESLVAEDASIIFNPKQASRRTLDGFPNAHIVLADATRLTPTLAAGIQRFHQMHKPELASVFKLSDENKGHFYDQSKLILRAEGTRNVIVIFVDEIIPPSIKP